MMLVGDWRVLARKEKMKATAHLFKHPLRVRDASGLLPPLPSAEKNFRYAHSVFLLIYMCPVVVFTSSSDCAACTTEEEKVKIFCF